MSMKIIPFTIDKFKELTNQNSLNWFVKTTGGAHVRVLCTDKLHITFPVVALRSIPDNKYETIDSYRADGGYLQQGRHAHDLVIHVEEKEMWINVYPDTSEQSGKIVGYKVYKTKEEAALDVVCAGERATQYKLVKE